LIDDLQTELDGIAFRRDEEYLADHLISARFKGSTDMTECIRQPLPVAVHTDMLDPDVAVEQDEVHTSLSRLTTQQIGHALQKLADIKVLMAAV